MEEIEVISSQQVQLIDITATLEQTVRQSGTRQGALMVYSPHTTAGITINEHADPTVKTDIAAGLAQLIHDERIFQHAEGNSPAHLKASLIGSHQIIIIEKGRLVLGTWQGIFFCEFDGPRRRKVFLQFLSAS